MPTSQPRTRPGRGREVFWRITTGVLAVAFAVTFTTGRLQTSTNASTLATQNRYLAEVATYANYLAETISTICQAQHLACPKPPSFPDPPGLPRLGLPK